MRYAASVTFALLAAGSFALAAVAQQEATMEAPATKALSLGLIFDLLRHPKWLLGGLAMLAGFGLQATALAYGPVALVQPVIVLELVFAIPLAMLRRRRRAGSREILGVASVAGGIALFLYAASPAKGTSNPPDLDWAASLLPVAAVAVACLVVGAKRADRSRPMLLGATAGLAFGVLSVLTKAVTNLLREDPASALSRWQVLAAVGVGIFGLVVSQSAYQAGPLAYSMPFVGIFEPLVAVVIGDTVLGESVRLSPYMFALELVSAALATLGVVLLTTSHTVLSIYEETERHGLPSARVADAT